MNSVSNMLYLILIASLALTACEDKKEQPTKSRLDLKGFQIIRVDAETGGETRFSVEEFEKTSTIHISDIVAAVNYPPNVTLHTETRCWENGDDKNVMEEILDFPFTSQVPVYKLLPEAVLFRPFNTTSDTLTCELYLKAYDSKGNKWRLENSFVGGLRDKTGKADIDILIGKDELTYKAPDFPIVHREDWDKHSLRLSSLTELGSYKLFCENFIIEDNSHSTVNFLNFEWIPNNKLNSVDTDTDEDQLCRYITYEKNGMRSGASPYFVYRKYRIDFPKNLHVVRHGGTDQESKLGVDDFFTNKVYDISDIVSAETYPENLQIKAKTFCEGKVSPITVIIPFAGPTPFYSFLPQEVLFQVRNQSSDSLECTVEIEIQHTKADNVSTPLKMHGTFFDTYQARSLKVLNNSTELLPSKGEYFEINKSDLHQYGIRTDEPQFFDRYQLVCETFSLGGQKARGNYFDLKQMDFSKVQLRNSSIPLAATEKQLCRFFAYENNVLVGYSYYFQLKQDSPTPGVQMDLSQNSSFLGETHGVFQAAFNSSAVIGQLQITNPSDYDMYVLVNLDDTLAKLQWIGGVQGSTPQRVLNAKIYDAYPMTTIVSEHDRMGNENLFKIKAKETLRINYSLQRMEQCVLGGGHVQGMADQSLNGVSGWQGGATFGLQFEVMTPEVRLITSLDPLDPDAVMEARKSRWSVDKGAAKATGFIYSNDRTRHHYHGYVNGFQTTNAEVDNCRTGGDVLDLR